LTCIASWKASSRANPPPIGKAALIASAGGQRGYADWTNPDHRLRRLLSEFIGMFGLTFILSGGTAVLAKYGGPALELWGRRSGPSSRSGSRTCCADRPGPQKPPPPRKRPLPRGTADRETAVPAARTPK
jgi:putative intracellular protease/amidase